MILPQELYSAVWKDIEAKISNIQYFRVIMSLSEILEGTFFNEYIRIGTSSLVHILGDLSHITISIRDVFTLLILYSLFREHLDAIGRPLGCR